MSICRTLAQFARTAVRHHNSAANLKNHLGIKDIPGPKGLPLIGNTLSYLIAGHTERHHEYIDRLHRKYGPVVKTKIGPINAIYVSDPELMRAVFLKLEGKYPAHILPDSWLHYNKIYGCKRGLLFMEGEEWFQTRRIMNNLLLKNDSDVWLEESMKVATKLLMQRWKENLTDGSLSPDLEFETYRFSIDAIISLLWGTGYDLQKRPNNEKLLCLFSSSVQKIFAYSAKMYILPAVVYEKIGSAVWKGFVEAVNTSIRLCTIIINEILDSNIANDGLLHRLTKENIKREDIERIAIDFILAAGDTTAITTQWTLYLLATHPNIVRSARLQGNTNKNWCKSNFMKSIIKESMRLYPVAPFIARILPLPSILGDYHLDSGALVVLSTYTSGRDARYFHDPHSFLPQRWMKSESTCIQGAHVPYAAMPFAMGARSCIGKKIAMFQLPEVIGSIMDNFDMTLLNRKRVNLVMRMVSVPDEPIRIKFTTNK